ncbi:hypothetical protein [Litoreibacter janthinus]|uniref:Chitin binding Peritrophin-A domain-containing protein n=1 Tax=Litoreibacter janthinus TaxID=670154 RepID=A0A1I6HHA7_9RHOB|nr:hypothetical protein [Litoreibacter janthinus]SFR53856.1 hypothetical protein SAMN04488002_3013 [Litoreibacter janthinus]
MKTKTLLAALALTLTPAIASAECAFGQHKQAASCQAGSTWDAEKGACVAQPTG